MSAKTITVNRTPVLTLWAMLCLSLLALLGGCGRDTKGDMQRGELPVQAKDSATSSEPAVSDDDLQARALTPKQSATYRRLFVASVIARSRNLTPRESNEFSAIGIKVDGITTEKGRVQFIQKMVEIFGESRAREIGAVFYNDQGKATHAWPRPLENQVGSAIPFPE